MRIIALIDSYKNQLIILLNSYINQFFTQTSTILHYILFIIIDKEQIYTIKNQPIGPMVHIKRRRCMTKGKPKKIGKQAKREGTVQSVGDFCEDSLDG